jgi:hypothetical protein
VSEIPSRARRERWDQLAIRIDKGEAPPFRNANQGLMQMRGAAVLG